tara:strand:+ start:276 stop:614 length:339 start_codon:yes stop_codon:yes gene_type:complete
MKVRFIIKEQEETVPEPAAVKTDDQLLSSIRSVITNLDGAQLAALEKYAMALNSASLEEKKKKMTKSDVKKREKIVKGMKGSKKDFEKRYGKDAEDVMYATATKIAMKKKKK